MIFFAHGGTVIQQIVYNGDKSITLNIPDEGAIGVLISGGADSSLLCYLLVDTIQKNNLKTKIYPITAEMLRRPYCVTYATNVLAFISKATGFCFERHLSFAVPNHDANLSDTERNSIYSAHIDDIYKRYELHTVFNGNTANPPLAQVPDTLSSRRPASRDDVEWRRQQQQARGLTAPFIEVDKKVIATLYRQYGLIETLFPLTRSCEAELVETAFFTKDCFQFKPPGEECWWCRERQYGFAEDVHRVATKAAPVASTISPTTNRPDVHILSEKIYFSDTEYLTLNIPIAGSIGCDVSGGVDSALLCYLLAKTIMKYKLRTKLYPMTGESLDRPYNLRKAYHIVEFISETTGYKFPHHLCYFMPNHSSTISQKDQDSIVSRSIDQLIFKYNLLSTYCANIANPPQEEMPSSKFPDRPRDRDDEKWLAYQESIEELEVPFLRHDRSVIAAIYKKENLIGTLLPLTRSCESSAIESAFFTRDCFETRSPEKWCWGCRERAYGFHEKSVFAIEPPSIIMPSKERKSLVEKIYFSEEDFISLDIPTSGVIGCSMSGGTDSTLIAYLLARTIVKHNLPTKLHPITAELLRRPYNLRYASDAVKRITELTGFKFETHLSYLVPNHFEEFTDAQKDSFHSRYFMEFMDRFGTLPIYSGNTANPPIEKLPDTLYAERPRSRDNPKWRQAQIANPDLRVPFIHVDKKVIATLYKKYNLLETLFPITRSCEAELEETHFFTKDCFEARPGKECWWCLERAYGFNDLLTKESPHDRESLLY